MNKLFFLLLSLICLKSDTCAQESREKSASKEENQQSTLNSDDDKIITLGGGCYWCVEAVYEELRGVTKVISGFSGGTVENPSYEEVCQGTTGHAEVTQVFYQPDEVDLETILDVFWTTHNPTTPNRQGYDVGPQYRSIILYHDDQQRQIAEKSMRDVAPQLWDDPIVTEIKEFDRFYPAKEEHQDFYELNPNYGYCRAVINPKLEKFRAKFADKLKLN